MTEPISEKSPIYYSQIAIGAATFLGGPLAAGILLRRNFINQGKRDYAQHALFFGIVTTLLLVWIIFSIPEDVLDKIPNIFIPTIYTTIISLVVEKYQGKDLRRHQENNGQFYSGWRVAGVGFGCLLIFVTAIVVYVQFMPDDYDTAAYEGSMMEFQKHEEEALQLFTLLDEYQDKEAIAFIHQTGIPAWQQNIKILNSVDTISGLYEELKLRNQILREYCQLRIQSYEIIEKSILEETDQYDLLLDKVHDRINKLLDRL